MTRFFGRVDLFAPSLGNKDATIPCSFDFDFYLFFFKSKEKISLQAHTPKTNKRTVKQLFWGTLW